ncbi:unnamed protein product [Cuscuta europaea]|uniref:Arabidopsis retrotransposon Orf1 C-terminal domain-containing protein n=1 Tax=Cuscuta europaea TaxID=41803 RepID=A0A9P1ENP5_CUSEU|nr:unnamed protein product [Cuscuta europaea]
MRNLFHVLNMNLIFDMKYNCNERVIYEFLSSAKFVEREEEEEFNNDTLIFCLFNNEYTIMRREFAQHFGIPVAHERGIPENTINGHTLWAKMTGELNVSVSKISISHVQHPILRIFLKFLANCLLGRPNNHHTRMGDVAILTLALFQIPVQFNLCNLKWDHLDNACKKTGNIVVGGVIMHLASKFGYVDNEPIAVMHIGWLANAGCISFAHKDHNGRNHYKWHILPKPTIYFPIPSKEIPKLRYKIASFEITHYLLPNAIPPHLQAQPDQSDQPKHQEAQEYAPHDIPNPPHNPPTTDYFQQILKGQQALLAGFNTMNLNYTNMGEQLTQIREEQRAGFQRMEELRQADLHRYEKDYHWTYGPMYSYVAHHGNFSSMATPPPPPSWYDPSQWGNFGGSSSGGGGYDGGMGGDTTMGEGGNEGGTNEGFGGGFYGGPGGH